MSAASVHEILQKIEQLPEEDRALLDKRLAELDEAEWKRLATDVRHVAREKGIDQTKIDRAIDELRYGSLSPQNHATVRAD